jgi:uncharacterized protein YbcI
MKTKGEMESAVCDKLSAFELEFMGRGPKQIRAHLVGDILLVRLNGLLSEAEHKLVEAHPAEDGIDLYKQVRARLIDMARPAMDAVIHKVTGVKVVGVHHDFSAVTFEEFLLFMLTDIPTFREPKRRRGN